MLETTLFMVRENIVKTYLLAESGTYTTNEQQDPDDSDTQLTRFYFSIEEYR